MTSMFTGISVNILSEYVGEYGQGSLFKHQQNSIVAKQIQLKPAYSPAKLLFSTSGTLEMISDMF